MRIYTSESVSVGHPDKLADQISDALLDAFLALEPEAYRGSTRVAIETLLTRGLAVVAGEVRTEGYVDVAEVVRETIANTGYVHTDYGFDGRTCGVMVAIQEQSADIALGVDSTTNAQKKVGAGDQGMMFGYATRETEALMPLPLAIAHALTAQSVRVRHEIDPHHRDALLLPDAKSQVSVEYGEDGKPRRINTVVLSHQHVAKLRLAEVQAMVRERIINPVLAQFENYVDGDPILHINPTGNFVIGGPQGDTGVTGRKIIVDTYGGMAPHGGGAFSGKDPTKVDRSAAYVARYIAKNIVAAELAERCVVQLAYAIGVAEPVAINIETFGTETVDPSEISRRVRSAYDLTPQGIIELLTLLHPTAPAASPGLRKLVAEGKVHLPASADGGWNYHMTAENGHFGN
ncbi:MAG: methionine adenosyltransferase, partial [Fimbriimonadaceae bacterium]|nr:methionine adenosyltransferase [Fimbriimonadaceae bacterium]